MLVSYPKSGNTWVRMLIAHVIRPGASLNAMEQLVPDIYRARRKDLARAYTFPGGGRLLKSHESFQPTYRRVIYLVRDPRDVCVSYFHYKMAFSTDPQVEASFEVFSRRFLQGELDPYGTWSEHVCGWLCAEAAEVLLVKYEDLLNDTSVWLERITEYLDLEVSRQERDQAIQACSLSALQKKERQERDQWLHRRSSGDAQFFRRGGSASRGEIPPETRGMIETQWSKAMEYFGYV